MTLVTQARLKELYHYNEGTGEFTRLFSRCNANKAGILVSKKTEAGYFRLWIDGRLYMRHRLAWLYVYGEFPAGQIDHINGIRDDNRIANLRDATPAINAQNTRGPRRDSSTGLRGVVWSKRERKYLAHIYVNKRSRYLGRFETAESAYAAYLTAKRELHPGCTI